MSEDNGPSWTVKLSISFGSLLLFAIFTWLRDGNFGATVAFAGLAISVAAWARWDMRHHWYYWMILAVVTVAHIAIVSIFVIHIPSPAKLMAPVVIVDFALIVALLTLADRAFSKCLSKSAENS